MLYVQGLCTAPYHEILADALAFASSRVQSFGLEGASGCDCAKLLADIRLAQRYPSLSRTVPSVNSHVYDYMPVRWRGTTLSVVLMSTSDQLVSGTFSIFG